MAAAAAALGAAQNRILQLCRNHPTGVTDKIFDEECKDVSLHNRALALNALLQQGRLQCFKQGDSLIWKEQTKEQADKLKGLTNEDKLVFQVIEQSGNMGIWTKDMKFKSGIKSQPNINKAIKNLESRNLIKAVKSVAVKNRKVYMLFDLEPAREITGGAWYTEQEFDSEFVAILKQQCLQVVQKQNLTTLEKVAESVRDSGVTREELGLQEYKQIMDMLVLDGDVEQVVSTRSGVFDAFPAEAICYRASKFKIPESSAFTNIPCGVCRVIDQCSDGGVISPQTCLYYQQWLDF
eukprot:TRINITY_DN3374_c0_g1_i2.p1 TRINITY_DN3374_c0_g1~~TRINITY_DN3374_c0_g1_i2.p1  ORF type:complete len:294 (+),score=58.11 TRINITY_DN3374_c0_g1_i2:40-921(+)